MYKGAGQMEVLAEEVEADNISAPKQGGTGNTPPVSPPQGNNGGNGNPGPQPA
jgi:hypothetical protein